jgi:hypothetical protein
MPTTKVMPAIKAKFPRVNKNVEIQQDGAASHILENNPAFVAAATAGLRNITLLTQPTRSPDLNHLDLTYFRALSNRHSGHVVLHVTSTS